MKACRGAVISETSAKMSAERCASAISASVSPSMICIGAAARVARLSGPLRNKLFLSSARLVAGLTQEPNRLSPHRRWWSRKLSGAPTVKVCSHSETLASSTAIGFLSTP